MARKLVLIALLALLALAPMAASVAGAQQMASLTSNQLYVKAVEISQGQYAKLNARDDETTALLKVALAKIKDLETRANAQDAAAKTTLVAFANGDTAGGVDQLMAQASTKSSAALEDYKAAGALAFPADTARAVKAYEAAFKLAPVDTEVLAQLARLYDRVGRYDDELRIAALEIALTNPAARARGYLDRGTAFWRRGDYVNAEIANKAALDIAVRNKLRLRESQALGNLGDVAFDRGDLPSAENYDKRALALATEIGDKKEQAKRLGNLGSDAYIRRDIATAEEYYKSALALNIKLGVKQEQAKNLSGLGVVAMAGSDLAAAEDYFKRALALDTELGVKEGQARHLLNLGIVAWRRGDGATACDDVRRSLALYEATGASASTNAGNARSKTELYCAK
jgi:tetratricopeptide (TPR) repeat protein